MLRLLAENGYNISYGARKHFATYDIVEKFPSRISLIGLVIGVSQIYFSEFQFNNLISLILIIVSIFGFAISMYNGDKEKYRERGEELVRIHNNLKNLYYQVKSSGKTDFEDEKVQMEQIMQNSNTQNLSKQIAFSDWYAHFKLFGQTQYGWMDEQLHFTWKEKIPFSLQLLLIIGVIILIVFIVLRIFKFI
jgi:hypothetical protein